MTYYNRVPHMIVQNVQSSSSTSRSREYDGDILGRSSTSAAGAAYDGYGRPVSFSQNIWPPPHDSPFDPRTPRRGGDRTGLSQSPSPYPPPSSTSNNIFSSTPAFSGPPGSQHHAYPHGGYRPNHLFYAALQYQGYTSQGYSGRVNKQLLQSVLAESALEPPVRNMTLRVIVDERMRAVPVAPWGGREVVSIGDVFDALQAALPEYLRGGGRDEAQRLRRLADLIADNNLWGGI